MLTSQEESQILEDISPFVKLFDGKIFFEFFPLLVHHQSILELKNQIDSFKESTNNPVAQLYLSEFKWSVVLLDRKVIFFKE